MSDVSSRAAAISFAVYCSLGFLEVPDVVHRAGLVCQLWHKFTRSDALWKMLFRRDTPLVVHTALRMVIWNPRIDPVLAASAGITLMQHSVKERWNAVKWKMLYPQRHHRHYDTLAAGAYGSNLLSVVAIAQRTQHIDEALNVTVEVGLNQCPALHCAAHSGNVNIIRYFLSIGQPMP